MRKKESETIEEFRSHRRAYMKDWRSRNKDREQAKSAQYFQDNKARIDEYQEGYRKKNRPKLREYFRKYAKDNPEINQYKVEWGRRRRETDENYRILDRLRQRVYNALKKRGCRKSARTMDLIGCDIEFLRGHLEARFKDGMSWENAGKWHVDHIIPCAEFDLRAPEQQKQCFNYKNLQPLWAFDNLSKGKKRISSHT